MAEKYAEKNAPYIFSALERLAPAPLNRYNYDYTGTLPDEPGIYMFYIYSNKTEKEYPVYFGKTETSFRARIASHRQKTDGVINRYETNQFPTFPPKKEREQNLILQFVLVPLSPPFIIKLAESLFLCAFDFALNKMENGNERHEINDVDQIDDTKPIYGMYMREAVDKMEKGVSFLINALK